MTAVCALNWRPACLLLTCQYTNNESFGHLPLASTIEHVFVTRTQMAFRRRCFKCYCRTAIKSQETILSREQSCHAILFVSLYFAVWRTRVIAPGGIVIIQIGTSGSSFGSPCLFTIRKTPSRLTLHTLVRLPLQILPATGMSRPGQFLHPQRSQASCPSATPCRHRRRVPGLSSSRERDQKPDFRQHARSQSFQLLHHTSHVQSGPESFLYLLYTSLFALRFRWRRR